MSYKQKSGKKNRKEEQEVTDPFPRTNRPTWYNYSMDIQDDKDNKRINLKMWHSFRPNLFIANDQLSNKCHIAPCRLKYIGT